MKKEKYYWLINLVGLITCFLLSISIHSQSMVSSSYLPLELENKWIYISGSDTFSESIVDTQRIDNKLYFQFDQFREFPEILLRYENNKVFTYADTIDFLMFDFDADSGASWLGPPNYFGGTITLLGKNETVTTPIGTFTNCFLFEHFIGADFSFREYFAEGVGIVKRDVITIAGLRSWVLSDFVTLVLEETIPQIPNEYFLFQNYPNPFNPTTKIEFRIADFGFVILKVYDALGREVATLVNEEKPPGEYVVEFNASDLSSGVYFCILRVYALWDNEYKSITKKLMLLK